MRPSGSQRADRAYGLAPGNTNPQDIADPPPGTPDDSALGGVAPAPGPVGGTADAAAARPPLVPSAVGVAAGDATGVGRPGAAPRPAAPPPPSKPPAPEWIGGAGGLDGASRAVAPEAAPAARLASPPAGPVAEDRGYRVDDLLGWGDLADALYVG